jgi:hypothetical protein
MCQISAYRKHRMDPSFRWGDAAGVVELRGAPPPPQSNFLIHCSSTGAMVLRHLLPLKMP